MSKLTVNDIAVVQRQSDVISRNIRENDANMKAAINDNQDQIDAITSPVAGNEVQNGDFDSDSIWSKGTGWTISGGLANKAAGTGSDLTQSGVLTIGQTYTVTFTVSNYVAGTIVAKCGTASGTSRSADGTYSEEITCTANTDFLFTADSAGDYSIDSVIVNGSEIQGARQNASSLRERITEADRLLGNYVIEGLTVEENGTPDMTVLINTGSAMIDGVYTKLSSQTQTSTIIAPTNDRYDLIVMNSDNTLTIVSGNDSSDPDLPAIGLSQRPLARITLTNGQTSIINSDILDIREMGCIRDGRHWYFSIEDALDDVDATTGGHVDVYKGEYIEQIEIDQKDNVSLTGKDAKVYRPNGAIRALTVTDSNYIKINGFSFYGNAKTGFETNCGFEDSTNIVFQNCYSDANASSVGSSKSLLVFNCSQVEMINNNIESSFEIIGTTDYLITTDQIINTSKEFDTDLTLTDGIKINRDIGNAQTDGQAIQIYHYENTQSSNSASYTKVLDVDIGELVGTFGVFASAFIDALSVGATYGISIYKNGIATGIQFEFTSGAATAGDRLSVDGDVTVAANDNIQIYVRTTADTMRDPAISLRQYNLFTVERLVTEVL